MPTQFGGFTVPAREGLLLCGIMWLFCQFLKRFVVKHSLDNVPGPARSSPFLGNFGQCFHRHDGWDFHDTLAEQYGPVSIVNGLCGAKHVFVYDPKALHSVILRDQEVYEEASWFIWSYKLLFGEGLLGTLGDHHRKQRKMLNPVFSINHMRRLTPIFYDITHKLRDALLKQLGDGSKEIEVDVLHWMSRTALELIGQGGLGYSFDPLVEHAADDLGEAIKSIISTTFSLQLYRLFIPYLMRIGPPGFRRRLVDYIPDARVQRLKRIINTMDSRSREIFHARKLALANDNAAVVHQVGEGKDIMSILLAANSQVSEADKLPEDELVAQMSCDHGVRRYGHDLECALTNSVSSGSHPDVQEKLRNEVLDARNGEDISYDRLVELPYLDAVCRETLRLHAPISQVFRETRRDILMPLSEPIRGVDGTLMHEIPIPKDTGVIVSIRACNRNKALWGEDALEWKPERWLSPPPKSLVDARLPGVYSNLMTFIGGGRACIGFKFSQLEMKVVLSVLVSTFKFGLSRKEIVWNLAGVQYPTVGKDSNLPSMPMILEPIKQG